MWDRKYISVKNIFKKYKNKKAASQPTRAAGGRDVEEAALSRGRAPRLSLPRARAAAEAVRMPAWARRGSRVRLCGVGKEPKQGASRGRSGLGMRRATHARAASRELRPAAAQRRQSTRVKGAHGFGRIGARPGRPGPGETRPQLRKCTRSTTSRRLEQTETGGPMVIQRPKSIARGMRSYPYFDGQGIIIIFKKKRWAGNNG